MAQGKKHDKAGAVTPIAEHALIIGCLLGDGFMQRTSSQTGTCRLRVEHSVKQREYVDWKRERLCGLCKTTQLPREVLSKKG